MLLGAGHSGGGGNGGNVTWVAALGAFTGAVALLWNVYRSIRDGERVHTSYSVYSIIDASILIDNRPTTSTGMQISIWNTGTQAAYVESVRFAKALPRSFTTPGVRRLSYATRRRWPLRLLFDSKKTLARLRASEEARHAKPPDSTSSRIRTARTTPCGVSLDSQSGSM